MCKQKGSDSGERHKHTGKENMHMVTVKSDGGSEFETRNGPTAYT